YAGGYLLLPDAVLDAFCFGVFQDIRATHPVILFTPSHYLSLFISILIFLNPFYYRAGYDEQQHIYSRYKIR
ncbi:hypothetical protein NY880_01870, partial [Escherichia coli]|uniref:hypothetical protein n=1 Tax=Escherichia coli TaxID=562 RepID=UPI0022F01226